MKRLVLIIILVMCSVANAITYKFVDSGAGGNNDGTTWEHAWTSIVSAHGVAADTTVLVKTGTTYTVQDGATNSCLSITANGTVNGPVTFQGDDASGGAGPGALGTFTLDANTNTLVNAAIIPNYTVFVGCRFTGASGDGAECGANDYIAFHKCTFDNNDSFGCGADNNIYFINCIFHTNNYGFDADLNVRVIGCEFYNNTSGSMNDCQTGVFLYNVFHEHADVVSILSASATHAIVVAGNVFHGSNGAGTGISLDNAAQSVWPVIINNSFYNLSSGITSGTAINGSRWLIHNNHFESNTADTDADIEEGQGTQTGAPQFTDEAASAADAVTDYTPASGSPLIDNGLDQGDI